jgi:formimidoylglutamate deiminase
MQTDLLSPESPADFFTVDLQDASIAGATRETLLSTIVFSMNKSAVKDVVVGGKRIVENGRHFAQEEITMKFADLQQRLWS